jgi:hypothetical protein
LRITGTILAARCKTATRYINDNSRCGGRVRATPKSESRDPDSARDASIFSEGAVVGSVFGSHEGKGDIHPEPYCLGLCC